MRTEQEQNLISKIVVIAACAFLASFAVGFERLANNKKLTVMQAISVTLMHGVCGTLFGMVASAYIGDTMIVYSMAGIGGLMGSKVIYSLYAGLVKSLPGNGQNVVKDVPKEDDNEPIL